MAVEDRTRDRLGLLCTQLSRSASLERIIREGGARTELDRLRAAVSSDSTTDPAQLVRWLDAIEEACARWGLSGTTIRRYRELPPDLPLPRVEAWTCPRAECGRVVLPDEAGAAPTCVIAGQAPMKHFQVPP